MVMVNERDGFHLYYQDVGFPLASGFTCGPGRFRLMGDFDYVVGAGSLDDRGNLGLHRRVDGQCRGLRRPRSFDGVGATRVRTFRS